VGPLLHQHDLRSVSVTILELITACLAAYAFARMKFRGKGSCSHLPRDPHDPGEATLIPKYVLMSRARGLRGPSLPRLVRHLQVQIVPFIASAFSIFLMRQFFPLDPERAGGRGPDGRRGHLRFLWSIVLPLSIPALSRPA